LGKNAIGGRSATSEIALQRKGEGGQRSESRINAVLIEPSSDFSGCCCHYSLALQLNVREAGFYTSAQRGSSHGALIIASAILNGLRNQRSIFFCPTFFCFGFANRKL
jgi:hypothetical protein